MGAFIPNPAFVQILTYPYRPPDQESTIFGDTLFYCRGKIKHCIVDHARINEFSSIIRKLSRAYPAYIPALQDTYYGSDGGKYPLEGTEDAYDQLMTGLKGVG